MVNIVRWGIAGCGWVARDYVAPAIAASANGTLAALHDVSPASLARAAALFPTATPHADPHAFFASIDAVYIASPNDAHRPLVEAAAAAGIPVLCEKPMATTLADARAMVAACERAGVPYATAFDQRFHPAHQHLATLVQIRRSSAPSPPSASRIAAGLGPEFANQAGGDNWRIDPARAGGGALDGPRSRTGWTSPPPCLPTASRMSPPSARVPGARLCGGGRRVAHCPHGQSGVLVQLHVAYNCPETFPRRRLEVIGTAAQIVATDTMGQTPGGTLDLDRGCDRH